MDENSISKYLQFSSLTFKEMMDLIVSAPDGNDTLFSGTIICFGGSTSKTVDVTPQESKPNLHYQHSNGVTKTFDERWDEALRVSCPVCSRMDKLYCVNMSKKYDNEPGRPGIKYPHTARVNKAQRLHHDYLGNP